MIELITGQPGNGKTLFSISELFTLHKQELNLFTIGIPELSGQVPATPMNKDLIFFWYETEDMELVRELLEAQERAIKRGSPKTVRDIYELEGNTNKPLLSKWFPRNSAIVVDEAHFVFPKSGTKTPEHVIMLSLIRHYGLRIILLTQYPDKLHTDVMGLVGKHRHIASRWNGRRLYEWSTAQKTPDAKSIRNDAVSKPYKLNSKLYGMYHSSTQHIKMQRKVPVKIYFIGAIFLITPLYLVYTAKRVDKRLDSGMSGSMKQASTNNSTKQALSITTSVQSSNDQLATYAPVVCLRYKDQCECYDKQFNVRYLELHPHQNTCNTYLQR